MLPMIAPPQLPSSSTSEHNWVVPPLDGSLSLPQILHFNYTNNGNEPLFVYADANNSLRYISWRSSVSAAYKVAATLLELQLPQNSAIAIFAKMDFATYWAYVHGALVAGYRPFPISPRNSPPIVAHLLKDTSTSVIITDADGALHKIAMVAVDSLKEALHGGIDILTAQPFHEVFKNGDVESLTRILHCSASSTVSDLDSQALILHTSGSSSAFPKAINLTHRILVQHAQAPWYGDINTSGQIVGAASLVLFHVIGFLFTGKSASMGSILAIFPPDAPSSIPTPDSVIECYIKTSAKYAACVPSFLEKWAEEPAHIEVLKRMKAVIYGGGMLHTAVGDMLSQQGVSLITTYGLTEIGTISEVICYPHSRESWEYFRISKMMKPVYQAQNDGTRTVEVYILPQASAHHTPAILNSKLDGCDCYKTNDLLEPHPEIEGLWRVYGRVDSQIILSTGEKTNPTPIEAIVCESPLIQSAVMFGRGRSQNGIILDLYPEHVFDSKDDLKLAQFRLAIRPFIDKANAYAPSHSRLIDNLIIVASPAKPFSFSSKGAPRRATIIDEYSQEIDAIYNALGEASNLEVRLPDSWDKKAVSQFIDELLCTTLEGAIGREDDIFHAGCSSLQATQILNVIRHALQKHEFLSSSIPDNFVYEHPTPSTLIDALFQVGSHDSGEIDMEKTSAATLESLLYKYTELLPPKPSQIELPSATRSALAINEDVVLLTGSTGALGCAILSVLAQDSTIRKVYAINRPHKGKGNLKERQEKALNKREMDSSVLQNSKVVLLEADVLSDNLGISSNLYSELKSTVTRIIHVAWSVRWDIQVSSFEPQIASVRRLVDFALECSTPPLLIFTSSISVLSNWAKDYPAPELPVNAQEVAGSGGYAESKWVSEQILLRASKTTDLRSAVVRVGQLTGLPSGAWNASEWVPSIIRSASSLGCLPDAPGEVSWLPIMSAARYLASLRHTTHPILHLIHPNSVQWHTLFSAAASALNVPLVPYAAWVAKLDLPDSNEKTPAAQLLSTFRNGSTSVLDDGHEALGAAKLAFINAEECLPELKEEKPLCQKDVEAWIRYWQRHGLL